MVKVVKVRPDKDYSWMVCRLEDFEGWFVPEQKYEIVFKEMTEEELSKLHEGEW